MAGRLVLVLGGARSGKSGFAQALAAERSEVAGAPGRVCYIATADAGDGEMAERIEHHRASRPQEWTTVELPGGTGLPRLPAAQVGLLDCFTVYLSNLMARRGLDWAPQDEDAMPEPEVLRRMAAVEGEAMRLVADLRELPLLIAVSNEVGWGVVPPYRLGRVFRDLAGRLNQAMARDAAEVYMVAAGLPLQLKG
ncbi:MAG: bifunctional adenosylcobinamide kinase/adenosylcobinamide-phosphate guanylyltransferase [Candidatus Geothermincolia bacterium]